MYHCAVVQLVTSLHRDLIGVRIQENTTIFTNGYTDGYSASHHDLITSSCLSFVLYKGLQIGPITSKDYFSLRYFKREKTSHSVLQKLRLIDNFSNFYVS